MPSTRSVVAGTMLGEVDRDRFVRSGGCRVGDVLLLAGAIPVEGASIIAREKRAELLAWGWTETDIEEAANYLFSPGISVTVPALAAAQRGLVTPCTIPPKAAWQAVFPNWPLAADVGMTVDLDAIPIPPLAARLCATYRTRSAGRHRIGRAAGHLRRRTMLRRCNSSGKASAGPVRSSAAITPQADGLVALDRGESVSLSHRFRPMKSPNCLPMTIRYDIT